MPGSAATPPVNVVPVAAGTWRRRFTAPRIDEVRWVPTAPDRLAVVSTEDGSSQAWAWDRVSGERRRVSDAGVGAEEVHLTADGESVVWWLDPSGDERGRWMATPFGGGPSRPLLPDRPDAWMAGISLVDGAVAAGFATDEAYEIVVARDGLPATTIYRDVRPAGVGAEWPQGPGGLSADGSFLAIRHAERSDIAHPAVRVIRIADGRAVGEILDEGRPVWPVAWAPMAGDARLVVGRETGDRQRPWLWDLATGELTELSLDLPGDIAGAWWYPDGRALLLHHDHDARGSLHRFALADRALTEVVPAIGTIAGAGVRPDGTVWYRAEDGVSPPTWRDASGAVAVRLPTDPPPPGRSWEDVRFTGPSGAEIQGLLMRPDGPPPYPTIVSVHGGPEHHDTDAFSPIHLAYADAGHAVLTVNYRGSTGYGAAFRESLREDVGFGESGDIVAGLDHLVALGVTDPERVILEGWSWGGYLATLNAGLRPDRWRGIVAGIPVGDLVAAHYESAPALQAWDVATFGGSPMEAPARYHERDPMTYVDAVRAPVLIVAGEHDSRCPIGQVMTYAHALLVRDHPVEVHLYPGGHHANDVAERIRQVDLILGFIGRCLAVDPPG